jgi:hypothetical protein
VTDEELKGAALQMLNMARTEFENEGLLGLVMASYFAGEGLRRMRQIEQLVERRFGVNWLNDERAKDIVFAVLRQLFTVAPPRGIAPPDGIAFAMCVNMFVPTEAFALLPAAERDYWLESHARQHEAVERGLFQLNDALTALVQTPERVCVCTQVVNSCDRPELNVIPQAAFEGRLRLFGKGEKP